MSRGLLSFSADARATKELLGVKPGKRALLMLHPVLPRDGNGNVATSHSPIKVADVRWVSQYPQQEEYLLSPCHMLHLQRQPERLRDAEGKPFFEKASHESLFLGPDAPTLLELPPLTRWAPLVCTGAQTARLH